MRMRVGWRSFLTGAGAGADSSKHGGHGSVLILPPLLLDFLGRHGGHRLGDLPSYPLCQPPVDTQDAGQRGQALGPGICFGCHLCR